jgi:ribonuclease G
MSEELPKPISKELVITSFEKEIQIALLEDKKLVEIHKEKSTDQFAVGDIYLGVVKKTNSGGMNAAFVNIGSDRDAFLHYFDLGNHARTMNEFVNQVITNNKKSIANFPYQPEIPKVGKINEVLTPGQKILVQVAKEPISTKGATVTTEISLAGRFLVLVPLMDKVTVSQKIKSSAERRRLKNLVQAIRPKKCGIIIRTVANGKNLEEITKDMNQLVDKWKLIIEKLPLVTAPAKVAAELDISTSLIRDIVNESFEAIHVDNPVLYQEIKQYLTSISSDYSNILKLYKNPKPIFETMNVSKQIKGSFGKIVTIKNGIYLVIEHTEAMHVIDVNSGNRNKAGKDQEENATNVNLEAAAEIARQLRLRDMGGIITIDFIDMKKTSNRTLLYQTLVQLMKNDKAKHTILPVNKFGLIQITRQRVRQATIIETSEQCPTCHGTGKVKPTILIEEEIQNMIEYLIEKQIEKKFYISVHPIVHAYLTQKMVSKRFKWSLKYKQWIKLVPNQNLHLLEFKFFNKDQDQIVFWTKPTIEE